MNTNTSRHYVFSEKGTVDGVEISSQYEVWFDEKGYYRFNTISGPYTGDYEIWDGKSVSKNDFETPNLHIKLDDDEQTVLYSQHQENGKPTHTIKVDELDKNIQFDKSLLVVDESNASIQYLSE
ncbi:hypothetical protein LOZ80_28705 [Paenibacillus sp. HWE-109]|uniref:hypothetical protein n=1 Tax=Paenibacillus sp. HWE-109 TaxID=1306526 RepID=UPI001EE08ABD|nr:hypothetical protein [Paenibacillus sp. HWE-109]UKS25536.1 hypothetical protein LOZ80_28705 [Paenibacillus sp. HWE-109]